MRGRITSHTTSNAAVQAKNRRRPWLCIARRFDVDDMVDRYIRVYDSLR